MSPLDYMTAPLRRYADFSGRSRRMEYWMFVILNIIVLLILRTINVIFGASMSDIGVDGIFTLLIVLALLIPNLAVAVRRLHDQDKSGWWLLLYIVPLGAIVLIVFFFLEGTKGDNRFGKDPKEGNT